MRKLYVGLFASLFFLASASVLAQDKQDKMDMSTSHTMKGYLVDKMCAVGMAKKAPDEAMAKAAKHTKSCALEESCQESGFGLMSGGMWYKFDDNGDKLALALLKKTEKEKEIMVSVTGTHDGDIFKVTSLKEVKSNGAKKTTKPAETKQGDMKMD
ncbi:MAG TPA: hypothetical protein VMF88_07560 [Bacteroidota bacterium]|nr:hypothetical protein [Bacteroidota bacterium]